MSTTEITEKAQAINQVVGNGHGGKVEIVGSWIWVEFGSKPSQEIRDYLKAQGSHWNQKRKVWQISNGYQPRLHSPMMTPLLRLKYGAYGIEDTLTAANS